MITNNLFKHQEALINSVRLHPEIPFVFLIGGFGAGKSASDVFLCLFLIHAYAWGDEYINIGILGVTIKLLRQTVIADLERALDQGGIAYKDNPQAGFIKVGKVTFYYLAMQNPDDIFAYNFHAAICDEIDEVPTERVRKIVTAIQERSRKILPAGRNMPEREPFIVFTTTAQGLGGTYHLIRYLEQQPYRGKKGVPYIKIRARTADNTSLAPQQLELLRSLYTEDEARAYLDGEFVNLSSGRVYPEFDRRSHATIDIAIKESDILYVGQDFNYMMNAAVICIVRGDCIIAVKEHRWTYVGDAARQLRLTYPNNRIIMIPDASGKEIMQGFAEEFEQHNVEIHWNRTNPSIVERITAVNKALRFGQLKICISCDKLIMGMETRDFVEATGKPRKGLGPDSTDHENDSLEYAVWHIIHTILGYDKVLDAIRATHPRHFQESVLSIS